MNDTLNILFSGRKTLPLKTSPGNQCRLALTQEAQQVVAAK